MSKKIIYTKGQKVNNLAFIKELRSKNKTRKALFQCYCGKEFITQIGHVVSGHTNSCGCYKINKATIHGLSNHKLYRIWDNMKDRCYNINRKSFKYYGAKKITVCDEWKNNPKAFIEWGEKNGHKEGLTIERIDNYKGYSPSNCTFATRTEQNRNTRKALGWDKVKEIREMKRKNRKITQQEIADIYGVNQPAINRIINNKTWI